MGISQVYQNGDRGIGGLEVCRSADVVRPPALQLPL
jgi:hypothetical protein